MSRPELRQGGAGVALFAIACTIAMVRPPNAGVGAILSLLGFVLACTGLALLVHASRIRTAHVRHHAAGQMDQARGGTS